MAIPPPGAAGYDTNSTTNSLHQVFSSTGQLVKAHFSSLEWVPDAAGNILTVKSDPSISSLPYATWLPNNPVAPQTYADILSKYDAAENVLWRTYLPGQLTFITTDPANNIYIAGSTRKTDIATPGTWQTAFTVSYLPGTAVIRANYFLAKISPQGQLLWCTYVPVKNLWMIDASNTTVGIISSKDFLDENSSLATPGAFQTQKREYAITSLDAATGRRNWGTYYGDPGTQNSVAYLRVTPNGFLVQGYEINGQGYFATPGALKAIPTGKDVFISRFSADGSQRLWSTYLGTNGPEDTVGLTGGSVNYSNGLCYKNGKILYLGNSAAGTNNIATAGAFQTTPTAVYMTMLNEATGGQIFTSYYGPNTLDYQRLNPGSCAFSDTEDSFYITGRSNINSNLVTPGAPYTTMTNLPSQPATTAPAGGFLAKFKYNPLLATAETASPAAGLTLVDNPNAGVFKILGNSLARENCTVQLMDMAGRLVFSQKLKKASTAEIQLPAETAAGNYLVTVTDQGGNPLKTWQMQVKK